MKETDLYRKMVNKLSPHGMILQRIEMDHVPDLFYRTYARDGWIEFKILNKYPIKSNIIKVPWRPGQMNWIKEYRVLNGTIFLFFYVENALLIFKGLNIKEQYSLSDIIHSSCYREFWKEVNWDRVYELLIKG